MRAEKIPGQMREVSWIHCNGEDVSKSEAICSEH